jgi:hypothetical protein
MILWRKYFSTMDMESTFLYLFIDASPQWRGTELFASSIDVIQFSEPYLFQRRLMPQIRIARHLYTTVGKTVSVLYQLFLMFGTDYQTMRTACDNVAGLTTDLGTERRVPESKDILIPFLKMMGVFIPKWAKRQEYLFPKAMLPAGWNHLWDGLLCFGLCSLVWFSPFLRSLKALVRVLREDLDLVKDAFGAAGLDGSKAIIGNLRVPSFAHWRWGTIHDICKSLRYGILILREHVALVIPCLGKMKDGTRARLARHALTSFDWFCQFSFVAWFSEHLCESMSWGGSCHCHVGEWERGEAYECDEKGRLLPWAFQYASARLQELLTEANSWTVATWQLTPAFFVQVQAMVRSMVGRGYQKFQFLDELPYIIARLGVEAGIRDRLISKYDSRPKAQHDKTSIEFLDPWNSTTSRHSIYSR